MGRKNFSNKAERRRFQVKYAPSEHSSDWEVIMTDGKAVERITVTGTRVSAWNKAIRIGLDVRDEDMPGVWWPLDISPERQVAAV